MEASAPPAQEFSEQNDSAPEAFEFTRTDVCLRVLYTFVLSLILNFVGSLLAILIVIQMVMALVTRNSPHPRLNQFAQLLTEYFVMVMRYVTFTQQNPWAVGLLTLMGERLDELAPAEQVGDIQARFHKALISNTLSSFPFPVENPDNPPSLWNAHLPVYCLNGQNISPKSIERCCRSFLR